jgi:hypothetical protein
VVIPLGLPCYGKTFFWEELKLAFEWRKGWSYDSVSTDAIRASEMDRLITKDSTMTRKVAFDLTAKTCHDVFYDKLISMLKNADQEDLGQNHVIFLDSNIPIFGLSRIVEEVNTHMPKNVICRKVYMIPDISERSLLQNLPLSASFLL